MSEIDPVVVAKGLSEAERSLILRVPPSSDWFVFTNWSVPDHSAMQRLQINKVFDYAPFWTARWNDLGLAVRAILEKSHV